MATPAGGFEHDRGYAVPNSRIRLIRRYLLKKESFGYEEADHYWLELIEVALNSRPRRVLGYRTPEEVAGELTGQH